ncbi:hypothetical protein EIN_413780, partial [Entamoeba invadens IP1]
MICKLEPFYLRNVLLYLKSLSDITNFVCINKMAFEITQSLYINPYSLPITTPIKTILKIFPRLETLFLPMEIYRDLSDLETSGNFLFEFRRCPCDIEGDGLYNHFFDVFSTEWYPKRVRKMYVFRREIQSLSTNIDRFDKLIELIYFSPVRPIYVNDIITILNCFTLRRVTLGIDTSYTRVLEQIDFEKYNKISFYLLINILENIDIDEETITKIRCLPQNVNVHVSFITKKVHTNPFLKNISLYKFKTPRCVVTKISNDALGESNLLKYIR